ncbi:MAG: 23S rRNA (uracil(1939)-C(5))-methyltransferase RlmD [Clostridiaceae bacterium]|jgi:23S rRNA (uracil1939-C5)-methyltransferase|nr:23S rRNA (uracil(1939)-C(5))-methyltransferase RlmD [Clostridiaceae bacterium]
MQENDEIELNIESLSNLGFGIAHKDGMVVFVENSCPEDKVLAKVKKVKKSYANAITKTVIEPSCHRVEPFCSMQKVCGACQLQFIDYDYQLELKKKIVEDAMHSIAGIDIKIENPVKSPEIKEYRYKIQYPVSQKKVSERLLVGYYKPESHEIVNLKHCPIQPAICDKIVDFIRENAIKYGISGYNEKSKTGDLRHIVLRVSKFNGNVLVVLVVNTKDVFPRLKDFTNAIKNQFDKVVGVCVNFNTKPTNVILGETSTCVVGQSYVEEKMFENTFRIGVNTFFQVNPQSAENIFKYIKDYIKENFEKPTILDAYAGIAAIGMSVADCADSVKSVEMSREACENAKSGLRINKIDNLEIINSDTEKYLDTIKRKFDIIITDPPRKGSTQGVLDGFLKTCKKTIIYLSCNPATLARDLKYLVEKGCKVKSIQPFDMFCHTYHIENVAIVEMPE